MSYSLESDKNGIETDENDFEVVIIGAGVSGLAAANKLVEAGLSILLIEKKNFPGGRLLSMENSKSYYVHESQYHMNKMMRLLNLTKRSEKIPESRKTIHCQLNTLENDVPFYVIGEMYYFLKAMDEVSQNNAFDSVTENTITKNLSNSSVEDMLNNLVFFAKSRSLCSNLIYATCDNCSSRKHTSNVISSKSDDLVFLIGTNQLETVSALWYLQVLNGAGGFLQRLRINLGDNNRYYVKGGAMRIVDSLTEKIERENRIRYVEEVRKIQFSDDRAHVWSETSHYKCDYVILTVPVTNDYQIIIEPNLPSCMKKSQIESENIFFNATCETPDEYNSAIRNILISGERDKNPTLIYDATCLEDKKLRFSGFSSTINMSTSKITEIISKFCTNTRFEFDNITIDSGNLMNVFEPKDWIKSSCSMQNHERVLFAGSEYAIQWPGTIDGAIESGELAALSILQWMRPQSVDRLEWDLSKRKHNFSKQSRTDYTLLHTICFCINLFVATSFLRKAVLSLMEKD